VLLYLFPSSVVISKEVGEGAMNSSCLVLKAIPWMLESALVWDLSLHSGPGLVLEVQVALLSDKLAGRTILK